MTLADLGWEPFFAVAFAPYKAKGWVPARIMRETSINYGAFLDGGDEIDVILCGKLWHDAENDADLPAVGDWVAVELGNDNHANVIRARLPRKSRFSRKAPGKSVREQIIGANIDVVAIVTDAGADDNLRRIERYFALVARSGAKAVVLVNKSDLYPPKQSAATAAAIQELWSEADVHIVSALRRKGLKILKSYLGRGKTLCIVGSSGVGKSTLVNQLYGDDWQWTGEVNETTGKGRHTTTMRELIPLDGGGMLIDNPGMREIQMWTDERTLRESFLDLETLSAECRFADCKHGNDAGCAIRAAEKAGKLSLERLNSFLQLDEEIAKLRKLAKKRQMTIERWAKRDKRSITRNFNDRVQQEREIRGDWR